MSDGLKYCVHCLEAIQLTEAVCVHCGQKQRKISLGNKLSTMLLLGLVMPACQKPTDPSDVEKNPVEEATEEGSETIKDAETEENTEAVGEDIQPYIPEGTIKALYGVEPVEIKKMTYDVAVSLDIEEEKSEAQIALEQQLQTKKSALEACYSQGWRPGVSFPSELKISIEQEGGKITKVTLGEEQDSKLGQCLKKEIEAWTLPADTSSTVNIKLNI